MAPRSPSATNRLAIASLLAAIGLWVAIVWTTERLAWDYRGPSYATLYALRGSMMLLATVAFLVAFALGVVRQRRSPGVQRTCMVALATVLTLTLCEGVFMFVPRSHNVGYTLGAQIWGRYYWRDKNLLGYRDGPHVAVPGKRTVFVVGDSFTAGAGMERTEDRFADRINAEHPELHLVNVGKNGSDTIDEYRRLQADPLAPDAVVLQYYLNDIEGAAQRAGWPWPAFTPYEDVPCPVQDLLRGSFLLNWLYWEFPHADGADYVAMLDRALTDDALIRQHLADLERFCTYTETRHIPLVVVLFPFLTDPAHCRPTIDRVEHMFRAHHVPVLDVAGLLRDVPVRERTANPYDAHPSPRVHALVAAALGEMLATI
jgi:lysophospholipase L1-like esterase